ncbi:carbohydrate ABC transporter permease [Paenibacillus sp. HB172176]|uniref:carbohydrate ABC transporter permease n=1 Tax=Paenibacillus sp. HB172176 TaxID=2493690 RepID=UPI00143AF01F|nr:carbohydrate ABC transporter permease [Paenibacillus sp. HB172176]
MNSIRVFRVYDAVIVAIIAIAAILCLVPFMHLISISLSSNNAVTSGKVGLLPVELDLESYRFVFQDESLFRSLGFTVVLTAVYTLIAMALTIFAAYPLTKRGLKGRNLFMFLIVFTMFFGGGMIPDYILVKELGLLNTMWALVFPGMLSAFNLIILKTFFSSIPEGLEESAQLDGCTPIGVLFRIILPLSMPVLATLSLFYAVGRWNGFMDSLMYITKSELYPLQLILYQMVMNSQLTELTMMEGGNVLDALPEPESLKAATIMFATLPIIIVYPWLQKYFVSGIMIGAVKG